MVQTPPPTSQNFTRQQNERKRGGGETDGTSHLTTGNDPRKNIYKFLENIEEKKWISLFKKTEKGKWGNRKAGGNKPQEGKEMRYWERQRHY